MYNIYNICIVIFITIPTLSPRNIGSREQTNRKKHWRISPPPPSPPPPRFSDYTALPGIQVLADKRKTTLHQERVETLL